MHAKFTSRLCFCFHFDADIQWSFTALVYYTVGLATLFKFFYKYLQSFAKFAKRTHEDESTVLFKTISLDGTKPNTNAKNYP